MKTLYRDLDYAYGTAMQKLRNAIGVTQAGLADRVGVSWRTVAGWEAGSSYPRAEHLKALIALAVQQQAFSVGHEAEEIRALWKVAHQKILLDEHWLSALLDQQSRPQEQALRLQPRVEPEPVEEIITPAQVTEQEPANEEPTELRTPSDQSSLVPSSHLTGLDAVACQPQGQSHEQPPAASPLVLEAETTGTPPALPNGSFPQTLPETKADRPRRRLLVGILIALVIITIIGSTGILFLHAIEGTTTQAPKNAYPSYLSGNGATTRVPKNTYPSYLSGNGTLAFFDPLDKEGRWHNKLNNTTESSCQFTGGTYHVNEPNIDYFAWCLADGIFGNFAFEVQLTITQGDCGGMTIPGDFDSSFYKFSICQDGSYSVSRYGNDNNDTTLQYSDSSAIRTGLGQQNKIAVVASSSTMIFYANERQIGQELDSSHTSGKIALIANPYGYSAHATDVAYSNARLWTL